MTVLLSTDIISNELSFLATVVVGVVCYMAVVLYFFGKENLKISGRETEKGSENENVNLWHDGGALNRSYPLSTVFNYGSVYFLSAFTSHCLLNRILPSPSAQAAPKLCVSRSRADTEKIIHPLIKKIESRLRRAEIRPRPRLRVERSQLPFPLFSATKADQELTGYVIEFLDASIDLSSSCDTQVRFELDCQADGIRISALWTKNQLISDATSQIELLNDMRLTFHGETIRWEYQIFFSPQLNEIKGDDNDNSFQKSA